MPDDLRSKVIRLAASMPKGSSERKALLDMLSYTDEKGLEFNFSHGFSFSTVPVDPYGQVYSGYILMQKPGRMKAYRAAMEYVSRNRSKIQGMRRVKEVLDAIDGYAIEKTGQTPYWHHYLMPD
jgi:hypothetical protein